MTTPSDEIMNTIKQACICLQRCGLLILVLTITVDTSSLARSQPRTVHLYVALCDIEHQGVIQVSPKICDGNNPKTNLYWGSAYGVKIFFKRSREWKFIRSIKKPHHAVLERCIFVHRHRKTIIVADAYRGRDIKRALTDFLESSAGYNKETIQVGNRTLIIGGGADLISYTGHNGLMDFTLEAFPAKRDNKIREVVILACKSKDYFKVAIKKSGALPLLWTTGLMAPEAYILKAAIDGWMLKESNESIRLRAAKAYCRYQRCTLKAAKRLFVTGH